MIDTKTPRNVALFAILKEQGGINARVPPGKYHFNVLKKPGGDIVELLPA